MLRRADVVSHPQRLGDDVLQVRGPPRRVQEREVERLVHLVGTGVVGQPLDRLDPGLGAQDAVGGGVALRVVAVEHLAPAAVDLVHAVLVPHRVRGATVPVGLQHARLVVDVRQALALDQAVGHVDAEPVHTPVQPEAQHLVEHLPDLGVLPVQVRLGDVEDVQVPLAGGPVGLGHPGPGRPAEDGAPVVGWLGAVGTLALPEHVAVALGRPRSRRQCRLEPGVGVGGVVGHQVDEDPQAQVVSRGDEGVGVLRACRRSGRSAGSRPRRSRRQPWGRCRTG